MTVNLVFHKNDLLKAYNDVVDPKTKTDWALFGYAGNSNILKPLETGEDGLEELSTSFNSGQIQYAIVALDCPATNLPKIVLIHWQGDGVQTEKLGTCAAHIHEVKTFFKGVHLTHHARNEDDVEPDVIRGALAKVTSTMTSSVQSPSIVPKGKPIGSVYQPVIPTKDINQEERQKFWEKTEKEEEARQVSERRRLSEQTQELEEEKKRLEERLHHQTEELAEKEHWKGRQRTSSDQMRLARLNEAEHLIGKKSDLKAMWETRGRPEKASSPVTNGPAAPAAAGAVVEPVPIKSVRGKWPPPGSVEEQEEPKREPTPPVARPSPPKVAKAPLAVAEENGFEEEEENLAQSQWVSERQDIRGPAVFSNVMPRKQEDSDEEEDEEEWEEPIKQDIQLENKMGRMQIQNAELEYRNQEEEVQMGSVYAGIGDEPVRPTPKPGMGTQAQALWDYQAVDDSEITVNPGDVICEIDMVDPGWWRGRGPDGRIGLFPANYVELLE